MGNFYSISTLQKHGADCSKTFFQKWITKEFFMLPYKNLQPASRHKTLCGLLDTLSVYLEKCGQQKVTVLVVNLDSKVIVSVL